MSFLRDDHNVLALILAIHMDEGSLSTVKLELLLIPAKPIIHPSQYQHKKASDFLTNLDEVRSEEAIFVLIL